MRQRLFLMPLILAAILAMAADWPQFRGPGGLGIAPDKGLPVTWSADTNLTWKTKLPGPGSCSPIVVGHKILLTCFSGYGLDLKNPGDLANLKKHLVCLDRAKGKVLWTREVAAVLPEARVNGQLILHGYASSTAVSDGKNVYVFLGISGVFAFDLEGKQLWQTSVGKKTHDYGSAASPVLYKDLVIVNANIESGALVALDKNTGKEMWRAAGLSDSWSTPQLVEIPKGGTELVVSEAKKVLGFDPDTGKELWHVNYNQHPWYVCASLVTHAGVIYAFAHNSVAIRAGGRGDVTTTQTLWQKSHHCLTSPVYHEGYLYFPDGPVAFCVKADDGQEMYRERLVVKPNPDYKSDIDRPGDCYASPLAADGKIYCVSRGKGIFVLEAGPKFKQLAHNTLDADAGVCNGNPAVSNGQLLLRSDRYLYCIGKKE